MRNTLSATKFLYGCLDSYTKITCHFLPFGYFAFSPPSHSSILIRKDALFPAFCQVMQYI